MITRPFDFARHLRRPSNRLEAIPFLDLCALGLFFVLLSSRFVVAPGVQVGLPSFETVPRDAAVTSRVLTVREVQGKEMLIYEGRLCTVEGLERILQGNEDRAGSEILLVRADRDVSLQLLGRVWEACRRGGFGTILLAAEAERAERDPFR